MKVDIQASVVLKNTVLGCAAHHMYMVMQHHVTTVGSCSLFLTLLLFGPIPRQHNCSVNHSIHFMSCEDVNCLAQLRAYLAAPTPPHHPQA